MNFSVEVHFPDVGHLMRHGPNAAYRLEDLREPPGNRLKALKGDLAGYYSIRVNDQWRVVFRWQNNNAHEVWLTDYH